MTSVLKLGPFQFEPCRIRISGRPPLDDWEGPFSFALWCQRASPWWIGDMLNAGDARFGETFSQICQEYGISTDMVQRYKGVARRVPAANRRPGLSWSAHAVAARLPADEQRKVLLHAEKSGMTSEELRRFLRKRSEQTNENSPADTNDQSASDSP